MALRKKIGGRRLFVCFLQEKQKILVALRMLADGEIFADKVEYI